MAKFHNKKRESTRTELEVERGLSCDASLGFVLRGNVLDLQAAISGIAPILKERCLRTVYSVLYPGRLWIKREPVTEPTQTEGDAGDRDR